MLLIGHPLEDSESPLRSSILFLIFCLLFVCFAGCLFITFLLILSCVIGQRGGKTTQACTPIFLLRHDACSPPANYGRWLRLNVVFMGGRFVLGSDLWVPTWRLRWTRYYCTSVFWLDYLYNVLVGLFVCMCDCLIGRLQPGGPRPSHLHLHMNGNLFWRSRNDYFDNIV